MNKIFIDTNIFIYNSDSNSRLYQKSNAILVSLIKNKITGIITLNVINELHYFFLKKYNHKKAENLTLNILKLPNIKLKSMGTNRKDIQNALKLATKYKLKTFDAFHAYYCKKEKIKEIATFDKDFANLSFLKIYRC